jgi:hypothetical protein
MLLFHGQHIDQLPAPAHQVHEDRAGRIGGRVGLQRGMKPGGIASVALESDRQPTS